MDEPVGVEVIETEWITLPDGTRLAARIWLPENARANPAPAVLEFLPYRRRDVTAPRDESTYPGLALQGIAGVRVDMRGTGDSDGLYDDEYSETELSDAEAVIAWIASQPWCSGSVGMMGISWGGFNALQVAWRKPPALKAVISIASTVDRFADDIHYRGGAQLSAQAYWSNTMLGNIARPPDSAVVGPAWREIWQKRLDALTPPISTWLRHQRRDDFWRHGSVCEDFSRLITPSLVIAGWADGYRNTPWKAVEGTGGRVRALTGPWIHKYPHFAWPRPRADFVSEAGQWFNRWLAGRDGAELPLHRLFVSEAVRPGGRREDESGRWVSIDAQSPASESRFWLVDSRLADRPGPAKPVTISTRQDCGTEGGEFFTVNPEGDLPGDQRADDALSHCFETGRLEQPIDLIGRPVLRLRVALDAPVGALVARLVDVHPDGAAHRVSMAILNLTHRHGSETPNPMDPGKAEPVEIVFDAAGYRFKPGHRIRLALSTAYFPMVLPAPGAVAATIETGTAELVVPRAAAHDVEVSPPDDPSPLPRYPMHAPASASHEVRRDPGSGRVTVDRSDDTGEIEHPGNGMIWRETRRSSWSIGPDDPLGFEGVEEMVAMRLRDGVQTEVTAHHRLTASAERWFIEASLTTRVDGAETFSRAWRSEIERDLM
ncbi:CocE/NonD family hydrolase [Limibaculum sp. M0105]|uniref:CocE/NonD family hydrolase n=1 Tax=Thermohalobaculum xanthum TaxID=2753746 RepID=A0A8J7M4P1_9RHOB|nr:CocE/NonD family hydrolase [Thermohalobaculum xanthum]MBK0398269.1 CocE/NonD family hydrolase [Thermohalobaculum xanthum]